jgi:hypothetical protein
MNPCYGDYDPYHMAASAIDEAIRNCVAVGADPARIAILDNFCWGYTDRPETLGSLVRAALACHDVAVAMGTPFISGKDSLNNEFSYLDADGTKRTIAIPPSLLISAREVGGPPFGSARYWPNGPSHRVATVPARVSSLETKSSSSPSRIRDSSVKLLSTRQPHSNRHWQDSPSPASAT